MDDKLLKKLQKQSVEMARRLNIPVEEALAILVKGRSWASKQPIPDGKTDEAVKVDEHPVKPAETGSPAKTFEQKIAEAVQSGVNADVAFQAGVRANPAEAREYFLKQAKGEK